MPEAGGYVRYAASTPLAARAHGVEVQQISGNHLGACLREPVRAFIEPVNERADAVPLVQESDRGDRACLPGRAGDENLASHGDVPRSSHPGKAPL
jgi:hypothetical protein